MNIDANLNLINDNEIKPKMDVEKEINNENNI